MKSFSTFVLGVLLCLACFSCSCEAAPSVSSLFFPWTTGPEYAVSATGGGTDCAVCTILVRLTEQYSLVHNKSVDNALDDLCSYLPSKYNTLCVDLVNTYGVDLISYLEKGLTPDEACRGLNFCTNSTCNLVHPSRSETSRLSPSQKGEDFKLKPKEVVKESPWDWIQKLINSFANNHYPLVDFDDDRFSGTVSTVRGYSWKGKDCSSFDANIYPGRKPAPSSSFAGDDDIDYDCNGISGTSSDGQSYEDSLCGNSVRYGTISLGDSATAHFRIPPYWMTAKDINSTTYDELPFAAENELDWPQFSWGTGHLNTTVSQDVFGPMRSIYQYLYEMNHCNHRDFQNIGVNGARTSSMFHDIVNSTARKPTDQPALVIHALIGNDVCNGHRGYRHMTTPEAFTEAVLGTLHHLDSILPAGSHVVFLGLVDGRILWNTLHDKQHPLGVMYSAVYDYLNCLGISPCWGWLNSDELARNQTSARAALLSKQYDYIIGNYTFQNFDMQYYDFPLQYVFNDYHGNLTDLIEPVDGFHPSQLTNSLIADILWKQMNQDHPEWFQVNPNNAEIRSLFGDQGGY